MPTIFFVFYRVAREKEKEVGSQVREVLECDAG
jgi:hypothetical protein